ncbi:MAG: hypothetical protein ACE5HQ_13440, partial [Gemmatimonadota bacterium]
IRGETAFLAECAPCHAARDGFDLAFFAFPDTTIIRRALGHVDLTTSQDIVAYIRTLRVPATARDFRILQPGGFQAAGDLHFALGLFGADDWPTGLTSAELAAIDPRSVAAALPFPLWSFEQSNLDWMPEGPIPDELLDYRGGEGRTALEAYYGSRRTEDLLHAVVALRIADRDPDNPDAPCVEEPLERMRSPECFEVRRWISSLVAQHMLRTGVTDPIHPLLHDAWWDVGNAARRSFQLDRPLDNGVQNWAVWMYLGWTFAPERHASVYLGTALNALGLPRHATFVALRSMVSRSGPNAAPYKDVLSAARFAPDAWAYDAVRFGYRHLLERLATGVIPTPGKPLDEAREAVGHAYTVVTRKVSDSEAARLAALRDQVLALLQ